MAGKSKAKTITIRINENTDEYEWIKNQETVSASVRRAIRLIINKYGTGDLIESILDAASLDDYSTMRKSKGTSEEVATEEKDKTPKRKSNMRIGRHKEELENQSIDGKLNNKPNFDMLS